ncbi:enoyl-CoA hydratase/isomerase family protein [Spongiibacter marinus]|uniref:enoyl-CoA hydratase/isomerase family protein n=1 Tax=Spongiibacter marinus TaxID=354246 RepID=UPI0035BE6B96
MVSTVSCEINNEIALVTMNNPPVNQFSEALINDVISTFERLHSEKIRAVILTGTKQSFQAGVDLNMFHDVKTREQGIEFCHLCQKITNLVANTPCPVIAMIDGVALGGGTELIAACDIRIASEDATFGLPEVGWGVYPGAGGTKRIPELIGSGKAKMLMFSGKIISAEEAYKMGLVDEVVSSEMLLETTMKLANMIAKRSPAAVRGVKAAIDGGLHVSMPEALEIECAGLGDLVVVGDLLEGAAAFSEKRKPVYEVK